MYEQSVYAKQGLGEQLFDWKGRSSYVTPKAYLKNCQISWLQDMFVKVLHWHVPVYTF